MIDRLLCLLPVLLMHWASAGQAALVVAGDVNVRAQASINSEIVTQLQRGETVALLKQGPLPTGRSSRTPTWVKIQLPANTPVWVHANYVDALSKAIRASRLNVRAGPGENFSIVGRLTKGEVVRTIRVLDDWMEIEAPPNTYGFVSARFLSPRLPVTPSAVRTPASALEKPERPAGRTTPPVAGPKTAAPPSTPIPTATQALPEPPSAPGGDAEIVMTDPSDAVIATPSPTPPQLQPDAAPPVSPGTVPAVAETPRAAAGPVTVREPEAPKPPRKRIVTREGLVRYTVSIQAPTTFELRASDTGKRVNWLLPGSPDLNLRQFLGSRVQVTGEEQMEPRWKYTPMIEVQSVVLAP